MRKRYEDAAVETACSAIRAMAVAVQLLIGPATAQRNVQLIRQVCSECGETPTFQQDVQDYHSERRWSVEDIGKTVRIDERNT